MRTCLIFSFFTEAPVSVYLVGLLRSLTLNGIPYSRISRISLRNYISYLSQKPFLFPGTIRDNIRIGNPEATEEQSKKPTANPPTLGSLSHNFFSFGKSLRQQRWQACSRTGLPLLPKVVREKTTLPFDFHIARALSGLSQGWACGEVSP